VTAVKRWMIVALAVVSWVAVLEGMIVLIALIAIWRARGKDVPADPDWRAFATYSTLLVSLSALVSLTVRR
jgi:hypothetical protein